MLKGATSIVDLGKEYQLDLLYELITDYKFAESVIESLKPAYFPTEALQKIIIILKNYYEKHSSILNFPNLITEINIQLPPNQEILKKQILDTVELISNRKTTNKNVKEYTIKFCKLQSLKTVINEIKPKIDRGIVLEYDDIETTLKNALVFKDVVDPIEVQDNIDNVLDVESENRIPTGIDGIDNLIKGGLDKGEVALVVAPLGVGKTTMLSKIASTAYLSGEYNVLQIFFEDKYKAVQRKHYTLMSGIALRDLTLPENKDIIKSRVKNKIKDKENKLFLLKLPATGVKVGKIKNIIKKLNSKGHPIDLVVIDYVDCLTSEKEGYKSEEWSNEGAIMRELEVMAEEMNVACWTATQGNRASTNLEVVRTENMGGNLKKAQIAHFIISIGKTLSQKEQKVATMAILKNRMGDDGMIFENCQFDNDKLIINTDVILTETAFNEKSERDRIARAREKLNKSKEN